MGVWSKPLFTNHPDAVVDITKLHPDIDNIGCIDILSYVENKEINSNTKTTKTDIKTQSTNIMKLHDIFMSIHDSAKIYGYLNPYTVYLWRLFMLNVIQQNPTIETLEFHFFCLDEEMPYYFRVDKLVKKQLSPQLFSPLFLYKGHELNSLYTKWYYSVCYSCIPTLQKNDNNSSWFSLSKYKKNYKKKYALRGYMLEQNKNYSIL